MNKTSTRSSKTSGAKKAGTKLRDLKTRKDVAGGKTPQPGGPQPIPYPNQG